LQEVNVRWEAEEEDRQGENDQDEPETSGEEEPTSMQASVISGHNTYSLQERSTERYYLE